MTEQTYYIIKRPNQTCEIVPSQQLTEEDLQTIEKWGPFANQNEVIARRVGLIRAGKCQPQ
ncbi:DDE transposase family protein [Calothrix sp. NIES-3974]|uniref:DDE transposase family protein n=1 Tax=Calothrix sp. NIES-3974 TaxID=2005462 RepID=UPI000BBBD9F9|nr:DDE transposase family protein [Calothrix sp. NIES-3974]